MVTPGNLTLFVLSEALGKIAEEILVFALDAPDFKAGPVAGGPEIGANRGHAGNRCAGGIGLQIVLGAVKFQPVAAGHVCAVDRQTHAVWRIPFQDCFFDGALVEIADSLAANGLAFQFAPLWDRQSP